MEEEFKEIELYGKTYKVSNHGRFIGARGELKQRLNRNGYCEVTVGGENNRNSVRVHRIVALLFVEGRSEECNEVNHIDFNRANPKADNLEWVTHKDNIRHSSSQDRYKGRLLGNNNIKARLSEEEVCDIRLLFDSGAMTQKELAVAYDVGWSTIHNICFRLTWTHLI